MKMKSIKFKILRSTTLCVLIISIISNLILYNYLGGIITKKSIDTKQQYVQILKQQLNQYFEEMVKLGILCASDNDVRRALKSSNYNSMDSKRRQYDAKMKICSILATSMISSYVNRLIVFNESSILIEANTKHYGALGTREHLLENIVENILRKQNKSSILIQGRSLYKPNEETLIYCVQIDLESYNSSPAYVYVEVDTTLIYSILAVYEQLESVVVTNEDSSVFFTLSDTINKDNFHIFSSENTDIVKYNNSSYKVIKMPIDYYELYMYNISDVTLFTGESSNMYYVLAIILATTICVAILVAFILSGSITRPIHLLIKRIHKITDENDFSNDIETEACKDEIGAIGKAVNVMAESISELMKQKELMYEQQKSIEIDFLQSQVTPHFLYNTLDSIYWMAVIQHSDSIANMTRALETLLRNVAKGTSDKITLREELSLLKDYINIQLIRYVEAFSYEVDVNEAFMDYRIIKFTLQPLVENAIFHGIEPTGRFGIIHVNAFIEGEDLFICVSDDGVGMDETELSAIMKKEKNLSRSSMSKIGVKNVEERLKLIYGENYGLRYESVKNKYTKVTVRIPKEV